MRKELIISIIVLFLQCEHKSEVYLDTKVVETYIYMYVKHTTLGALYGFFLYK